MLVASPEQVAVASAYLRQFQQNQARRLQTVRAVHRRLEAGLVDDAVWVLQQVAKEQMLESGDVGDQIRMLQGEERPFEVWRDLVSSWYIGPNQRDAFGSLDTWQTTVDVGGQWFEESVRSGQCPPRILGPMARWHGPAVLRWRARVWEEGWTAHLTRQLAEQVGVYCLAAFHGHRMELRAMLESHRWRMERGWSSDLGARC